MINNNLTPTVDSQFGKEMLGFFLAENNIPVTPDCIIDELNDPNCNEGLFDANKIHVETIGRSLVFIDKNDNRFLIRTSGTSGGDLVGWKKYAADDDYQPGTRMNISRAAMEKSGGEAVVFEIGLNIASIVEFGTNGVNDEVALAIRQCEELDRELDKKFGA